MIAAILFCILTFHEKNFSNLLIYLCGIFTRKVTLWSHWLWLCNTLKNDHPFFFIVTSCDFPELCWKHYNTRWHEGTEAEIAEWSAESFLGVGNNGANISKCHDEEGQRLDKEEDEEVVFPKHNIIAATKEEVECDTKFQQVNPNDIWTQKQ